MPDPEIDPEDRDYLSYNWGSLAWSDWVPFNADKHTFHEIPAEPGLYRIRPSGKDFLAYIGSTGQPLHTKLSGLRQSLRRADLMPWNDPHPEAPALWAWWKEWLSDHEREKNRQGSLGGEGIAREEHNRVSRAGKTGAAAGGIPGDDEETAPVMLECSAAPLDASAGGRKGMEAFLLYRYRQERGESTLCNFGRFHPRYRRSTNRKEGKRGGKLAAEHKDNPAGRPGTEPLNIVGKPGDRSWMDLEWTEPVALEPENIRGVTGGAGLYLLEDAGSREIMYIGQSADVAARLLDHSQNTGGGKVLQFSYQVIGHSVLPHHLKELENDLIGNFFEMYRKAPEFQFRNSP